MSKTTSGTELTIKSLDSFYCANVVVSLWADAVGNRLEGPAIFLLTDELAEVSEHARAAAHQLADRVGDLGGAITADPRELLEARPGDTDFELPDCGDVRSISEAGLRELGVLIGAYEEFLAAVRDSDPVSHQLVTRLLGDETHRRADIGLRCSDREAELMNCMGRCAPVSGASSGSVKCLRGNWRSGA